MPLRQQDAKVNYIYTVCMERRGYTNDLFYVIQQMSCAFLRSTLQAYVYIYIYIYSYTSQAIMSLKITFTDLSKGDRESMCHPKLQRGTRCDRESMTTGKTLKRYIYIYIPAAALTGLKHFFTLEATHASSDQEVAYKDALIPQSNLLY